MESEGVSLPQRQNGRVVAIIGASGGIGASIARRLSEDRVSLTLGYFRNESKARKLEEEIASRGGRVDVDRIDVTDAKSVQAFFQRIESRWERLDSIVVATGPPMPVCPVLEVTNETFEHIIRTEVVGAFNTIKVGMQLLRRQSVQDKSILFILSTAVQRSIKYDGMSYIPKMAVTGLIKQTVRDFGHEGIRLNAIGTGAIAAGMGEDDRLDLTDKYRKYVVAEASTPAGRMGSGVEMANVTAFLISDAASYVNGQIVAVDGGYAA